MSHCFISYSHADGLEFVTKLADELEGGHPFIKVWFEKREMVTGRDDWDDQLAKAIRDSKCLLFVMSKDSTGGHSNCKDEWTWALKYKKPVICLWIDSKAEDQFRLNSRQKIDFTSNFDQGLAKLRKTIAFLDSPEGELEELNHRLNDANRDLRRASEMDKPRIQAEIELLKADIQVLEKVIANPQAAAEQTQKNIETGLERERRPEKPTVKESTTKFINPPPGLAPNYFQDRYDETREILRFLNDDSQRMMTIVGRGGVGKTAMVCRLLKGLEGGELPDGLGSMKVDGIVYLSESGSHRVNFANLFYDLCKLLPPDAANALDAVYKNPQASTASKMSALLDRFTRGKVVLLLDNVEPLISVETFDIADAELDECLRALLHGAHSALKVILTTRVAPRGLNLYEPGRQRVLTLDSGLEQKYAVEMLREMDVDGKLGLKSADPEALKRAYERTLGFPRALEALFAILASDRYTTLDELLAMPTPVNVVEALVGEAFNRLDTNAQKVMQALAVYNRPVTPAAVDYLLAPHLPAMDSAPILQRLANMHFARKESGRFYLHPVDREFAFGLIAKEITAETQSSQRKPLKNSPLSASLRLDAFTQHDLTSRAADYFAQARKPRAEWKKLDDLAAQLAEFDLRCSAGDYDNAADVLTDIDFDYLLPWGHYRLMIQMHELLYGKITDPKLSIANKIGLGSACLMTGQAGIAIEHYDLALQLSRDTNSRYQECSVLGNLGHAYAVLGEAYKAIEVCEQALAIARELGNREFEANSLNNLANVYSDLGDTKKAIEIYMQKLIIVHETGNRRSESSALGNLGQRFAELGDMHKAFECNEQALIIAREFRDRYVEGAILSSSGLILLSIESFQDAIKNFQQALYIADETLNTQMQTAALLGLAQAYLFQNDLVNARATIEAALQYDVPENNHNASALHGIIALRQGDEVAAGGAFLRAIGQADEILSKTAEYYDALDAKGLAICGLILAGRGDPSMPAETNASKTVPPDKSTVSAGRVAPTVDDAIETFRKARKIAPHAGIVKSVLRLFDELMKCEGGEILKDVRKAVEGK